MRCSAGCHAHLSNLVWYGAEQPRGTGGQPRDEAMWMGCMSCAVAASVKRLKVSRNAKEFQSISKFSAVSYKKLLNCEKELYSKTGLSKYCTYNNTGITDLVR
jgi:hypothetical protein